MADHKKNKQTKKKQNKKTTVQPRCRFFTYKTSRRNTLYSKNDK